MSGILLRWINEELELKQKVRKMERDFSNGYLLGEILHIHNQQHNFNEFQEPFTNDAKVNNFVLLEPSLRLLGVHFDAQMAKEIMCGTPGAVSKLLYQVKMVLDRLSKFSVPVSMRSRIASGMVKPFPNISHRSSKPHFDRAKHVIFAAAVRDMVHAPKRSYLDRSLRRFEEEGARQKRHARVAKERFLLEEKLHSEATRIRNLQVMAQRKALCGSWEEKNVNAWMNNTALQRRRKRRERSFSEKLARHRTACLAQMQSASTRAVYKGIADYEAHKYREVITSGNASHKDHQATTWVFEAATQGFLGARTLDKCYRLQMAKLREKRSGERAVARETRRRRYTTEQEESLFGEYIQESLNVLKGKLMKKCQAEHQNERQLQLVSCYKGILVNNRRHRSQQYAARVDVDAESLLKRDQATLDCSRGHYEIGVLGHLERREEARKVNKVARAARVEKICRQILDVLVSLSTEVVVYREEYRYRHEYESAAEPDLMPPPEWIDMKRSFVRGGPLLRMKNAIPTPTREWGRTSMQAIASSVDAIFRSSTIDAEALKQAPLKDLSSVRSLRIKLNPTSLSKVANYLDDQEFEDFIDESGLWSPQNMHNSVSEARCPQVILTSTGNPSEINGPNLSLYPEKVDGGSSAAYHGVLGRVDPCDALGECVIDVSLGVNPLPIAQALPAVPKFNLRICMCGSTMSGKSEQAIRLADRYCLKVLSVEELARRAMSCAGKAMDSGRQILTREEALGQEATSSVLRGGTVPDKVYAALLALAIEEMAHEQLTTAEAPGIGDGKRMPRSNDQPYMGWIIDDFPGTVEQATTLAKFLSGYDETAHVPSRRDVYSKIAKPSPNFENEEKESFTVSSGVDLAIFLEVTRETIFKRSLGRLTDPVTCEQYHFEGSLPQYDVVCKERLIRPEDPANSSAQLALQVAAQEQNAGLLKECLAKFGTLRVVDSGDCTPDALFGKTNAVVVEFISKISLQAQSAEKLYETPHVECAELSGDNVILANPVGGTCSPTDTNEGVLGSCNVPESGSMSITHAAGEGLEVMREKMGKITLNSDLGRALLGHWRAAEVDFQETTRQAFREIRNQRLLINEHIKELRESFSDFLRRAGNEQFILLDFCHYFNFMDEDIRFLHSGCKELLLRTEECRSRLWSEVEDRKACANRALRAVENDGWIEMQHAIVQNQFMVLMQAEVQRFHAGVSLLCDYYNSQLEEAGSHGFMRTALLLSSELCGDLETQAVKNGKKDSNCRGGPDQGSHFSIKGAKDGNFGIDPVNDVPSGQTALPPCLIAGALIDAVSTGRASRDIAECFDSDTRVRSSGKGKTERINKMKKAAAKVEMQQVEEVLSPLGIALESVLEYVRMWTPEGSPLCHERAQRAAADTPIPCNPRTNNGGGETQIGIHRCTGTSAECLHRAVWTQAETLGARAQLIFRRGEEAVTMIHQKATLPGKWSQELLDSLSKFPVYQDLQNCLDTQVSGEARAVEDAMGAARGHVEGYAPIKNEWVLQGEMFKSDGTSRLVAIPRESPILEIAEDGRLRDALNCVRYFDTKIEGREVVTSEAAVDVLLRLAEEGAALPVDWQGLSSLDAELLSRFLDPCDEGEIGVEDVVRMVGSSPWSFFI